MHALCLQMITRNTLVDYLRIWCQKGYPPPDPLKRPTVERQTLVNMVWGSNPHGGDISQHDAGKFGNLL